MAKTHEIFGNQKQQNDIVENLKGKGHNEKEIQKWIKEIKEKENLDKDINRHLANLDKKSESFYAFMEKWYKKDNTLEKKSIQDKAEEALSDVKADVTQKATDTVDTAKKGIMDKVGLTGIIEKATSIFTNIKSQFTKAFEPFSNMLDSMGKKIGALFTSMLVAFGIKEAQAGEPEEEVKEETKTTEPKDEETEKETPTNTDEHQKTEETNAPDKDTDKKEPNPESTGKSVLGALKESSEKVTESRRIYYKAGLGYLLHYSGVSQDQNSTKSEQLVHIGKSKMTYDELNSKKTGETTIGKEKISTKIVEGLQGENTKTLLNNHLKVKTLRRVLLNEDNEINPELAEIFSVYSSGTVVKSGGDRLEEILELVNSKGNDSDTIEYGSLTLGEISILTSLSMSFIGILNYDSKTFDISSDYISDLGQNSTQLKDAAKIHSENIVPTSIVTAFGSNDVVNFGGKDFPSKGKLKEHSWFTDLEKADVIELDKLESFKEYITSSFLNEAPLLNVPKYKNAFNETLNYKYIILLYNIMGGEKGIDNSNLSQVIFAIKTTLGAGFGEIGGEKIATEYITEIGVDVLKSGPSNIFTQEQKDLFKIYAEKNIILSLSIYGEHMAKYLGIMDGMNENFMLSGASLAGGLVLKKIGSLLEKRAIGKFAITSRFGMLLRGLGYIGIAVAIISAISKAYSLTNTNLGKDLLSALGKEEDGSDFDPEKMLEILKDLKSEHTTVLAGGTEDSPRVAIIHYKDDLPLFMSDNKISTFGFKRQGDTNTIRNYKGENIDFSQFRLEGDEIVIGKVNSGNTIRINKNSVISSLQTGNPIEEEGLIPTEQIARYGNQIADWINEAKEKARGLEEMPVPLARMIPSENIGHMEEKSNIITYRNLENYGPRDIPEGLILKQVFDMNTLNT